MLNDLEFLEHREGVNLLEVFQQIGMVPAFELGATK
jgi:hypothetical protein